MKNVICCGSLAVVLAVSAAASAQERKMDDKMHKMTSETSYTWCIEQSPDGAFTLGHATASSAMSKKSTGKDFMAQDSMAHDSMIKDAMGSTRSG
jgi:hypothetical protein